jgi:hypothetical protein
MGLTPAATAVIAGTVGSFALGAAISKGGKEHTTPLAIGSTLGTAGLFVAGEQAATHGPALRGASMGVMAGLMGVMFLGMSGMNNMSGSHEAGMSMPEEPRSQDRPGPKKHSMNGAGDMAGMDMSEPVDAASDTPAVPSPGAPSETATTSMPADMSGMSMTPEEMAMPMPSTPAAAQTVSPSTAPSPVPPGASAAPVGAAPGGIDMATIVESAVASAVGSYPAVAAPGFSGAPSSSAMDPGMAAMDPNMPGMVM